MRGERSPLHELASLYGVEDRYRDGMDVERAASDEALLHVLRGLGAPLERKEDARGAIRQRQIERWGAVTDPVVVSWDGAPPVVSLRLPSAARTRRVRAELRIDGGGTVCCDRKLRRLPIARTVDLEGERLVERRLGLGERIPFGYHQLSVEVEDRRHDVRVLAAPTRAYRRAAASAWGMFAPTYALRTERSGGTGDLSDLEQLMERTTEAGGEFVATLPLFATFFEDAGAPSPYMPVSRLFWNELFLDPERVPELEMCPEARRVLADSDRGADVKRAREEPWADYAGEVRRRRHVLEELARCAFDGRVDPGFSRFLDDHPHARDYARFRATLEERQEPWSRWPARLRDGDIDEEDYGQDAYHYHLYVQWRLAGQLEQLAARRQQGGGRLYLDLPLGVHPEGYDAWRKRDCFLSGCEAGAPPDPFFTRGQRWGFELPDPEGIRRDGYDYIASCLDASMRYAAMLRIDHVMGLHRVFCVPAGMSPTEGVYVHYRPEELYAVLTLESRRREAEVVGEDLGNVPRAVRQAMERHSVLRMHVMQFEVDPDERPPVRSPVRDTVASLGTHDVPPFAAFVRGLDIEDRVEAGIFEEDEAQRERERRRAIVEAWAHSLDCDPDDVPGLLRASLRFLASSEADLVVVMLENLWGETQPQNVPGTSPRERPNWRHRLARSLEEGLTDPDVRRTLTDVDSRRRGHG